MSIIQEKDIEQCKDVVQEELVRNKINMSDEGINKFAMDVLKISYSTGGDFSKETLRKYIKAYIDKKFYEKYL